MASDSDSSSSLPMFPINYLKSDNYREIHCDGALGGLTPKGKICMSLFAERYPIPRVLAYAVKPSADPAAIEIDEKTAPAVVESRGGLVRNVELTAYMDLEVAKSLHEWLGVRIAEASKESK